MSKKCIHCNTVKNPDLSLIEDFLINGSHLVPESRSTKPDLIKIINRQNKLLHDLRIVLLKGTAMGMLNQ